jgi:hypothetical protein
MDQRINTPLNRFTDGAVACHDGDAAGPARARSIARLKKNLS